MDNILFSNSFNFNVFSFQSKHYTDNRKGCKYHYIGYLRQGSAKLVSNSATVELSAGDCFYIPFNCAYRSYWQGKPKIEFDSFGFTYFPNPDNAEYTLQKIDAPQADKQLLFSVCSDHDHSCENIGRFYAALGTLCKYMDKSYESKGERTVAQAIKFMSEQSDYKISEVAKHCNVSESGLYHLFREVKGATPIDVKHSLQVEKAVQMLSSTDMKVEEIAEKCGFCSAIYFRQIFKKVTSKTPSQLRKPITP